MLINYSYDNNIFKHEYYDLNNIKNCDKIKYLNCEDNNLAQIPLSFNNIEELYCCGNKLINLPMLSKNLYILDCGNNKLLNLPILLSKKLYILYCPSNKLNKLPKINNNNYINTIEYSYNIIKFIDINNISLIKEKFNYEYI